MNKIADQLLKIEFHIHSVYINHKDDVSIIYRRIKRKK